MALLDRFRTQPRHSHPDPAIRLAHVADLPIDDRDQLGSIARHDEDARVRRAAVAKLMDPHALAGVARDDRDEAVRDQAMDMLRDIALEAFEGMGEAEGLAAVDSLTDVRTLAVVAKTATRETVASRALSRISDARTIGSVARHGALEPIRRAALESLTDHAEIISVAMHSEFKDTAVAALDRLSGRADLSQVATRAKNKHAAKRARAILHEMDERAAVEAAAAPAPAPDPLETARVERLRLVQRLEALTFSGDLDAAESISRRAEADWAALDGVAEPALAERFKRALMMMLQHLDEARAKAVEQERVTAEAERKNAERARERAEEEAAQRRAAEAVAEKETARRHARLAELACEVEAAVEEADLASARRRLEVAQHEWRDLSLGIAVDSQVAARFTAAEPRLVARETSARDENARARREALASLQHLIARVEPLLKQPSLSLRAADRALRDVRAAVADVPPLPSRRDYEDITRHLKAAQAALTPKVQELREAEEWRRFANVAVQEQLCAKMEALRTLDDPETIAPKVRDLQRQWREAADVPRAQAESLWRRFKSAHDEVWACLEAHFAAQAETRSANLAKKIALCEQAEALADSTNWIQTADEIKRLQAEWKTVGPVTRGQEKAVWERFRAPCDRFFTRRQHDLAERKSVWARNLALKDALCVKAEALADSSDWEATALEIKRLQAEWKTIGPVKKTRSEAIWQRFRSACDRFFARYAQRHEIARGERVAAREAICAEFEALASSENGAEPPADCRSRVHGIRARWLQENAARGVEPVRAAALEQRFQSAFHGVIARWPVVFAGSDLDPEANRKRLEALVTRVEQLAASVPGAAASGSPGNAAPTPATRLAEMLKEALAANTIGGKADAESRWRAAQEEIRQAQASWARIGPIAENARRALNDRFQRACRRITEAASRAATAGKPGSIGS
jgi:hypothetical protein